RGWRRAASRRGPKAERAAVRAKTAWRSKASCSLPSVGALSGNHRGNGAQQDLEIEHRRLAANVLEIEPHPLLESDPAAAVQLPQAGEPGPHVETPHLPGLVLRHLLGKRWPRAHQPPVARD